MATKWEQAIKNAKTCNRYANKAKVWGFDDNLFNILPTDVDNFTVRRFLSECDRIASVGAGRFKDGEETVDSCLMTVYALKSKAKILEYVQGVA